MDKNPKVTVIMPAYNAERFLESSCRAVLNQSHRNLRLLVVNDGSRDRTGEILARLSEEDSRLRALTVSNGGPAMARNRALDALDGDTDYVMFMDADDELLPDAVEYALTGAARGAELIVFGYSIQSADGSLRDYCEPERLISRQELGRELARLYRANLLNQVWGKLYSARMIREGGFRFPDYRWGEDRFFVFDCLEAAERICVLPGCKYRYIMHEGESLISKYYAPKFEVCLAIDRRVEALCRRFGVEDDRDFRYMFLKSVYSCATMLFAPSCPLSGEEKRAYLRRMLEDERVGTRGQGASGGLPVQLLYAVMRSKCVGLNLAAFRAVARASETAPELVRRIKHRK